MMGALVEGRSRVVSAVCCVALLCSVACRSTPGPPPFVMPELQAETLHRAGGLLTGADSGELTGELEGKWAPDDCLSVHVRWFILRDVDETFGTRGLAGVGLASRTELVARVGGARVLSPTPRLARDAVLVLPDDARDPVAVLEALLPDGGETLVPPAAALPPGTSVVFDLKDPGAALRVARGEPGTEVVRVLVHRPATPPEAEPVAGDVTTGDVTTGDVAEASTGLRVALGMIGWLPARALEVDQPAPTRKGRRGTQQVAAPQETVEAFRELVVLEDRLVVDGPPLVLALPLGFASGAAQGLAVAIWVTGAPVVDSPAREGHEEALARCLLDLEALSVDGEGPSPVFIGLTQAFVGLENSTTRRAALSYLAHRTHAWLAADLSLVADDELLDAYVGRVLEALPSGPPEGDDGTLLGWGLERQALVMFSERLAVPDPDVVLESVLLRRLGETGRHPSYVKRLAERVASLSELDERAVEQNILWLEDPSPASRIRAHDWLQERELVPPGYDPLGTRDERRHALSDYHEAHGS